MTPLIPRSPWIPIGIGAFLVVLGVVLPLLMVLRVVPSTFFLNFLAYIASVLGLFLGIWGAALHILRSRRP
ncbi:MAG: hypothetical protein RMK65_07610 [Anaerolineae bacterium]|nr:hypothetical protein [Anaerolineae bacterium]MCX8067523.1 hypothetical protein [Anaerolineae bacterium]MDW7991979.1 hypothetical protein [Anaerolineae bacterium]